MKHLVRTYPSVPSHTLEKVASNRDHQAASASHPPAASHPTQIPPRNEEPRTHHRSAMQMALLAQVPPLNRSEYFRHWDAWAQAGGTSGEDRAEAVDRLKEWFDHHQPHETLSLDGLGLTSLPKLPSTLKSLDASGNLLINLPEHLPPTLESLDVSDNQLISLPQRLPDSLRNLNVSDNQLASLPKHLPRLLKILDASDNQLEHLPELPDSLQYLNVSSNELTRLPENLPKTLENLSARGNELSSLPKELTIRLGHSCVVDVRNNPLRDQVCKDLQEAIDASDYHGPQIHFPAAPASPGALAHASAESERDLLGASSKKEVKKTWSDESAAEKIQAVWKGAVVRGNLAAQAQQSTPYASQFQFQQASFGFSLKNLQARPIGSEQRQAEYAIYASTDDIWVNAPAFLHSFQRKGAFKSAQRSYREETLIGKECVYSPQRAGAEKHDMKLNSAWLLGLAHHGKKAVLTVPLDDETLVRKSAKKRPVEERNTEHHFSALGREVLGMVQKGHYVPQHDRYGYQVLMPTPQARQATLEDFKTPVGMKKEEIKEKLAARGIDVSKITISSFRTASNETGR